MQYNRKYTKELLAPLVASSTSVNEVCRKLGMGLHGGNNAAISKWIDRYGLDRSHFVGQAHGTSHAGGSHKKTPAEILTLKPEGSCRTPTYLLRRALLAIGVLHICAECGCPPKWNGKPLVLEVDHINGYTNDDTRDNLRFLCPNCHTQTGTNRGRNRGGWFKELMNPAVTKNAYTAAMFPVVASNFEARVEELVSRDHEGQP
jgi:hypothetical protein